METNVNGKYTVLVFAVYRLYKESTGGTHRINGKRKWNLREDITKWCCSVHSEIKDTMRAYF